jgi:H+-transporting ATPase
VSTTNKVTRNRRPSRSHPPMVGDTSHESSPDANKDLKELPLDEVAKRLESSADGLSAADAKKRLARYGPNEIDEEQTSSLRALLMYFWGPIAWMIEVAVVLSAVLGHWADFFIILLLLVANAGVGFSEEHQAGKAIAALKAQLAGSGSPRPPVSWCRAMSSGCGWVTSSPPTRGCSRATRSKSTSQR